MRFCLLDRICSLDPDTEVTAVKAVSLAEEYLADHFPEFPVLPGVFMLEAATQAATWLVRISENYAHSMIVLAEARSVKFTDFVTPGNSLRLTVEQIKREDALVHFKFQGEVEGRTCVSGRLTLECYNLADDNPDLAELDARMIDHQRTLEPLFRRGAAETATAG
jgi:3-hydroxyacyl-[acyl-carrier-protein] dehydratase